MKAVVALGVVAAIAGIIYFKRETLAGVLDDWDQFVNAYNDERELTS